MSYYYNFIIIIGIIIGIILLILGITFYKIKSSNRSIVLIISGSILLLIIGFIYFISIITPKYKLWKKNKIKRRLEEIDNRIINLDSDIEDAEDLMNELKENNMPILHRNNIPNLKQEKENLVKEKLVLKL